MRHWTWFDRKIFYLLGTPQVAHSWFIRKGHSPAEILLISSWVCRVSWLSGPAANALPGDGADSVALGETPSGLWIRDSILSALTESCRKSDFTDSSAWSNRFIWFVISLRESGGSAIPVSSFDRDCTPVASESAAGVGTSFVTALALACSTSGSSVSSRALT